jgi:hypothetical protein
VNISFSCAFSPEKPAVLSPTIYRRAAPSSLVILPFWTTAAAVVLAAYSRYAPFWAIFGQSSCSFPALPSSCALVRLCATTPPVASLYLRYLPSVPSAALRHRAAGVAVAVPARDVVAPAQDTGGKPLHAAAVPRDRHPGPAAEPAAGGRRHAGMGENNAVLEVETNLLGVGPATWLTTSSGARPTTSGCSCRSCPSTHEP